MEPAVKVLITLEVYFCSRKNMFITNILKHKFCIDSSVSKPELEIYNLFT